MQRSKLQAAVRQVVYGQSNVSTEGFLGDVISSIAVGLGLKRKPILSDREIRKQSDLKYSAVRRLKATVLNDKWLSTATFVTGELSAEHSRALYFSEYKSASDIMGSIKHGFKELSVFDRKYAERIEKHVTEVRRILDTLDSNVDLNEDDPDVDFYADVAYDDIRKLEVPKKTIGSVNVKIFGNASVSISNETAEKVTKKSILPRLPLLDKTQVKYVAETIIQMLEQDGLFPDVSNAVDSYKEDISYALEEALEDTALYSEYLSNNFAGCWYFKEIFSQDREILFALLNWLNSSVK